MNVGPIAVKGLDIESYDGTVPEGFGFERGVWTTRCSGGVGVGDGLGSYSVGVGVGVVTSTSSTDIAVGWAWAFRYSTMT